MYSVRYRDEAGYAAAAELTTIAAEVGCHPATLAVAWVGSHPAVTAPLIGGRTLEQLRPSLAAADLELDDELRGRITALTPNPPPATDRSEEVAAG
jgi:aryl-alcohol dehydrogenase-like predicted oxidoreductase